MRTLVALAVVGCVAMCAGREVAGAGEGDLVPAASHHKGHHHEEGGGKEHHEHHHHEHGEKGHKGHKVINCS